MLNWLEKHFSFSRRELTGICVFGVLLSVLWVMPHLYRAWAIQKTDDTLPKRIEDIERFLATEAVDLHLPETRELPIVGPVVDEIEYVAFDPNGLPIVEWKRLGLSDRQIRVIKNYEAKGGRFRRKEDLKKIYGLHEADYIRLEPYIRLAPDRNDGDRAMAQPSDERIEPLAKPIAETDTKTPLLISLNDTDSIALQQLPGIGPVYASRIIRFRNRLGGFHQTTQLMDVYGFDSVRFNGLKEYVYVDTTAVRKIDVNAADYNQLKDHPMISPKLANAIIQYRKQHGLYHALEDILGIAIMDEEIFRKIAPYLTISND